MVSTPIPAVLQARLERRSARRRYAEWSTTLNETFDHLYVAEGRDESVALLDLAANLTERLAELHTAAWGREDDAGGRSMAESLTSQAALLRQVAATERAVIGTITWPDCTTPLGCEHTAELRLWTVLAHTSAPGKRAVYLNRLRALAAEHLGERASEVLAVLAEVEEHRATGTTRRAARPQNMLPRVLIGAVLALIALVAIVPGLDGLGRVVLLVAVLAAAYVALCVYVGVRGRSQEVGR
ncbi:hypothetical protein E1281_11685 [Actinomadura sp. KC345]|uniref:hypothetical protein n=1 Tax=Actinomadura sp. KC345 TaxID=2530371 RepID=UPI00104DCDC3|nr:hypothetical protein [Actinomadura sp. KC345]TDC55588.1 hypothetical protein E1281_11685 [Actinomadura sp. KC345]